MPLEDFSTYTEVDPNTRITVTATRITGTSLTRPESAYVYDDKGANHFTGDFEHFIESYQTLATNFGAQHIWALFNNIGDREDCRAVVDTWAAVYHRGTTGNTPTLAVIGYVTGAGASDVSVNLSLNTLYYLTIDRTGNALTCKIYSDASRSSLVDTITCSPSSNPDFRYVYGHQTLTLAGSAYAMSGYCQNLDLREGALARIMHHYTHIIGHIIRG
jgi:hypothetical protein